MSKENREAILSEVKKIICDDRNEQYGEPEDTFSLIADYWSAYIKHNCLPLDSVGDMNVIGADDVAIMMVLFKLARIESSYRESRDSYIDAIGYMTCATDIEYPKSTNWEKTNADN